MSRFWQIISAVLFAAIAAWWLVLTTIPRTYDPPIVVKVVHLLIVATLGGVIWAIAFRRQLEKMRVSLFSLFCLISIEAIVLAAWAAQSN
jgi:hypothetical protein